MFQCTGSGTSSDSCLVSTSMNYDAAKPYCATATSHGGSPALGSCGACQKSDGVPGDSMTQGSCPSGVCCASGKCEAMMSAC